MPTLFKQIFITSLFVLLGFSNAQSQEEDLTKDKVFFEQQTEVYQKWLDHSGLGQYLKVEHIEVETDSLSLYLSFPFTDIDSVMTAWKLLKADFEMSSPLTLEHQLFYKASTLMDVPQSMINVQLYDTYEEEAPFNSFIRAIHFKEGAVKLDESNPKDKRRPIHMKPRPTNDGKAPSIEEFQEMYSKEKVFNCIYNYVQEKYGETSCEQENPTVALLTDEYTLRFKVSDLCREVLTNEANPMLCSILRGSGRDCDWAKRELLIFTITYKETTQGFRLVMFIDGQYGADRYNTARRGSYLSMEVDFDKYLEKYADELTTEIRYMLGNCQ